jgi:hypothetical protein
MAFTRSSKGRSSRASRRGRGKVILAAVHSAMFWVHGMSRSSSLPEEGPHLTRLLRRCNTCNQTFHDLKKPSYKESA